MNTMTNSPTTPSTTNKTDKTTHVSNIDFLQAIFGNNHDTECPILVSFKGNPNTISPSKWYGYPWAATSKLALSHDANNYFSLAQFKPDNKGEYRRKKSQFHALHVIMLDDIGTKVPIERLTLEPSWLLETSPGNYQAGYILAEPITHYKTADQLMKAIINAGLCDPGANGPTTRLARLPVAVNGKHLPPFQCQLKTWSPKKRYTVQQLIDGLQVEMIDTSRKKHAHDTKVHNLESENEQVWTPCPKENVVLAALKKRNIYKTPLSEGKHDITCPWVNEHTDHVDHGTAYFEPDDNYPIGGFKCQHGHCADKRITDLLRILDVDVTSARMKPCIRVVKGEMNRIIDAAEQELANTTQFYQKSGAIVVIGVEPSTGETRIQQVSQSSLVRALANIATWEQFDARSKNWVRIDPPARHASILYDSNNYKYLPVITGLVRQPYLCPNYKMIMNAGYNKETGMFGVFDSKNFSIPLNPSKQDAEAALAVLNKLLDEFSFASEGDRTAALCAMLTAAIRQCIPHAPMFHVRAHSVGSGKSYLCALITAFATPQQGTPTSFPTDDEECRKLLLAEFLQAPAVIEFDNLTSDILPHKSLCTALTSEFISGRILGTSKTAAVNTKTLFLSSGNNVTPIKDMTRRCITINLNPETEIPAARTYKRPDLISEILQERERYVSAALTIVYAWINAGKPLVPCKSLASFNAWSNLCRQPLLWLGCVDPATSVFDAIKSDPDRELLGRLLTTWHTIFANSPTMVRDAVDKSFANNEFKEILHDIADERGEINRRRLGRWIKRHAGQIVDGFRFVRCDGNTSAERWRVEPVSSVLSVSKDKSEESVTAAEEYKCASKGE